MTDPESIWIVEDDEDVREALADALRSEGYKTGLSVNGRDALQHLREAPHAPRLILLDLAMPIMDGFEFREAQRSDPALAHIPVVVLTAGRFDHERIAQLDVAGYIAKPPDLEELLATVRKYIECPLPGV